MHLHDALVLNEIHAAGAQELARSRVDDPQLQPDGPGEGTQGERLLHDGGDRLAPAEHVDDVDVRVRREALERGF